jgi:hypothetical protein
MRSPLQRLALFCHRPPFVRPGLSLHDLYAWMMKGSTAMRKISLIGRNVRTTALRHADAQITEPPKDAASPEHPSNRNAAKPEATHSKRSIAKRKEMSGAGRCFVKE